MGETKPVIKVNCFVVGAVQTNFYFLYREGSPDTIVFDPADLGDRLYEELDKRGLKVKAIFLTHAPFDHIMGLEALKETGHLSTPASMKRMYVNPRCSMHPWISAIP